MSKFRVVDYNVTKHQLARSCAVAKLNNLYALIELYKNESTIFADINFGATNGTYVKYFQKYAKYFMEIYSTKYLTLEQKLSLTNNFDEGLSFTFRRSEDSFDVITKGNVKEFTFTPKEEYDMKAYLTDMVTLANDIIKVLDNIELSEENPIEYANNLLVIGDLYEELKGVKYSVQAIKTLFDIDFTKEYKSITDLTEDNK